MPLNRSLSGIWNGLYTYPNGIEQEHFVAILLDFSGLISGTIHETASDFDYKKKEFNAHIDGSCLGQDINFVKTYDGQNGWNHSVYYSGIINEERTEIGGIWQLDNQCGKFLMIRRNIRASRKSKEIALQAY